MAELDNEVGFDFAQDAAAIWAALIDPAALRRWLAEDATIDPRVGGRLTLAGRGVPAPVSATITAIEPDRSITFDWPIGGAAGEATIAIEPAETGAKVSARHRFAHAPAGPRAQELVDDLWRLWLGNLRSHLMGFDAGIVLVDFDDPSPQVRQSIVIAAPRDRVWRALVEPAMMDKWISSKAAIEPRAGGAISYGWRYEVAGRQVDGGPSRILEFVEGERLVTDWGDWRGDPDVPDQRITWLLEDAAGGTRVTLIHDGFTRAADIGDYFGGWAWFLSQLQSAMVPE